VAECEEGDPDRERIEGLAGGRLASPRVGACEAVQRPSWSRRLIGECEREGPDRESVECTRVCARGSARMWPSEEPHLEKELVEAVAAE
jgi:hypothetical protein